MLYHEKKAKQDGFKFIIGVDEAGRGPLAGPVVAAAVALLLELVQVLQGRRSLPSRGRQIPAA